MKILFLLDVFLRSSGGAERVVLNLAKGFQKNGHQVYVLAVADDKHKAGRANHQGIKIFRLYSKYHERWRGYLSLYNPWLAGKIERIIRQIQPDVVHAHNIHCHLSYHALKTAKKYSRAVFITLHDAMAFHYGKYVEFINQKDSSVQRNFNYKINPWQQIERFKKRYNPLRNVIIRHYLKYVDKIFAISYALKDALYQNGIGNTEVIYNGIDTEEWQIEGNKVEVFRKKYGLLGKKIVFFIGRLGVLKGGDNIIKAMKIVTEQIPEALLLVAGKKDDYAMQMAKLAEKENVSLVLTGWIGGADLKSAYQNSHVVVTPSIYLDPFNLINIEAMACQRPVVGTCFGGTPEIVVDGETGYVVNPLNVKMMAEKIADLLKNPQKAKEFGENGFQRVSEKFSLAQQIEATSKYYYKYGTR